MSDNKVEFWRDANMDDTIEDIVDIFKLDGVELVRLSGLTIRERTISKRSDMSLKAIDGIVKKLQSAGILKYDYIAKCPHCGEISYIIKYSKDFKQKPKLCDSCGTFYALLDGSTLETINKG